MLEQSTGMNLLHKRHRLSVSAEEAGQRLDRYLAARFPELSRTRLQELVDAGHVRVGGRRSKRSHQVEAGETVEIEIPPPPLPEVRPEAVSLEILYADEDVAVVNKPAGMIVHPGAEASAGTLVSALLHRFGKLSTVGGPLRPGIVHRLDRGTSGALLIARSDAAHRSLIEQFRERRIGKTYLALLRGRMAHVNLIPLNPVEGDAYQRPDEPAVRRFEDVLRRARVPVSVRYSRGVDIVAGCGQLRARVA
jgi:23S rRNA pseudouridine1911/1915/1917 synthase